MRKLTTFTISLFLVTIGKANPDVVSICGVGDAGATAVPPVSHSQYAIPQMACNKLGEVLEEDTSHVQLLTPGLRHPGTYLLHCRASARFLERVCNPSQPFNNSYWRLVDPKPIPSSKEQERNARLRLFNDNRVGFLGTINEFSLKTARVCWSRMAIEIPEMSDTGARANLNLKCDQATTMGRELEANVTDIATKCMSLYKRTTTMCELLKTKILACAGSSEFSAFEKNIQLELISERTGRGRESLQPRDFTQMDQEQATARARMRINQSIAIIDNALVAARDTIIVSSTRFSGAIKDIYSTINQAQSCSAISENTTRIILQSAQQSSAPTTRGPENPQPAPVAPTPKSGDVIKPTVSAPNNFPVPKTTQPVPGSRRHRGFVESQE